MKILLLKLIAINQFTWSLFMRIGYYFLDEEGKKQIDEWAEKKTKISHS